MTNDKNWWQRLNGPLKIGLGFALAAIILTVIGIFRDPGTPVTAWSLIVGSLIGGVTWGVVSWAIATAAVTVENDVAAGEGDPD
jgi:F0F1-type ATP synthase assembly protein I